MEPITENGVHAVKVDRGNGKSDEMFTATVKKVTLWKVIVVVIPIFAAIVAAAAKLGVQAAIDERIQTHVKPPSGIIYQTAEMCAHTHAEKVKTQITEDLKPLKDSVEANTRTVSEVKGSMDSLITQQNQIHRDTMGILREIRDAAEDGDG